MLAANIVVTKCKVYFTRLQLLNGSGWSSENSVSNEHSNQRVCNFPTTIVDLQGSFIYYFSKVFRKTNVSYPLIRTSTFFSGKFCERTT